MIEAWLHVHGLWTLGHAATACLGAAHLDLPWVLTDCVRVVAAALASRP
jgi:hypothetical protein